MRKGERIERDVKARNVGEDVKRKNDFLVGRG